MHCCVSQVYAVGCMWRHVSSFIPLFPPGPLPLLSACCHSALYGPSSTYTAQHQYLSVPSLDWVFVPKADLQASPGSWTIVITGERHNQRWGTSQAGHMKK